MSDRERLAGYVELWWTAIGDLLAVLEQLAPEQWHLATDLPGWDVHAVVSHVAHLESLLAGASQPAVAFDPPDPPSHVRNPLGSATEQGVQARRDRSPTELVEEIRAGVATRRAALSADPPADARAPAPAPFGLLGWDTEALLRNRVLDVWMHEQDIRRAAGSTGNLGSPAARHTVGTLLRTLAMVLARRAGAPPGTTLVVEIAGHAPVAFTVTDAGRGAGLSEVPADPTVRLRMDVESFVVLAGGRRTPPEGAVEVGGDQGLARRILAGMAVTP